MKKKSTRALKTITDRKQKNAALTNNRKIASTRRAKCAKHYRRADVPAGQRACATRPNKTAQARGQLGSACRHHGLRHNEPRQYRGPVSNFFLVCTPLYPGQRPMRRQSPLPAYVSPANHPLRIRPHGTLPKSDRARITLQNIRCAKGSFRRKSSSNGPAAALE